MAVCDAAACICLGRKKTYTNDLIIDQVGRAQIMTNIQILTVSEVHEKALTKLTQEGFSHEQADAIAATVTAAERDGCLSHGLFRIPFYLGALRNERVNASATPEVIDNETSSVVHVNGHDGFCPAALRAGYEPVMAKAKERGIAALAIHNVYNIAALWPEVEYLAERGYVAFAFTAANAFVAPAGGTKPLFGTNPMAFGWPRVDKPPMVFDQASSVCARGEIQLMKREGVSLPDGVAIDADGNPTNDPTAALEGAQLPFGGHKGSSIALMIELLAGALIGDVFSYESTKLDVNKVGAPFGGEWLMVIDPSHGVMPGSEQNSGQRAEQLFAELLSQEGTRLPSDRRFKARRKSLEEGIEISENSDL